MSELSGKTWEEFSQAYAFLGNSLLKPMTQTSCVGLTSEFWRAFPDFGNADVRGAAEALACYADKALADAALALASEGLNELESLDESAAQAVFDKAVERVAVEYTHLFVGPPSPAAPPWETMNRHEGVQVGFGEPTFQMRELLREAGLELSNENRQYEDHMGIELLYLSELCRRCAQACSGKREGQEGNEPEGVANTASTESGAPATLAANAENVASFIEEHPLAWIDAFMARISESRPNGYFAHLLACARALLVCAA